MPFYLNALVFSFLLYALPVMAIEEPDYEVLKSDDNIEIRRYAPRVIAQTTINGSMKNATRSGFKVIADYIFGNNQNTDGLQENIAMTAPVTLLPVSPSLDMGNASSLNQPSHNWQLYFFMPRHYSLAALPIPNSSAVTIRELPIEYYAAITFSGLVDEKKVAKKTQRLKQWLADQQIQVGGKAHLARYNPPWTLPFLRRNEILLAIKRPEG